MRTTVPSASIALAMADGLRLQVAASRPPRGRAANAPKSFFWERRLGPPLPSHLTLADLRGVIRFCRAARSVGAILRPCGLAAIQVRPCDARRLPGRPRRVYHEPRLGGLPAQLDPNHDEIP